MRKRQILLIHWKEAEIQERVRRLETAGFTVISGAQPGSSLFKQLESNPPDAVVIDLTRLPSQGRDLAIAIRMRKGTRALPLVFLGGDPAKVSKIRALLPDAASGSWEDAAAVIQTAMLSAGDEVVIPESAFAAYAGKPLREKLGVKPGTRLAAVDAPGGFAETLGDLPADASFMDGSAVDANLTIWFVRSQEKLTHDLGEITAASRRAPVWVAWPKRASNQKSDLTQTVVRAVCMDSGMVDYKICAVDAEWSALLFTWRGG